MRSSIPKRSSRPQALAAGKEPAAAGSSALRPAEAAAGHDTEIPRASRRCRCPDAGGQDPIQEGAGEASGASEGCAAAMPVVGNNPGRSRAVRRGIPKPHRSGAAGRTPIREASGKARKVAEGCRAKPPRTASVSGRGEGTPASADGVGSPGQPGVPGACGARSPAPRGAGTGG